MAKARGLRTAINLLLALTMLVLLWIVLGQPLPMEWNYRRMERAMLREPMEILTYAEEQGIMVSVDESHLAIYCDDQNGSCQFEAMEFRDGIGLVAAHNTYDGLMLWLCEASEASVRAELELTLYHEAVGSEVIRREAAREDDLFHFQVDSAWIWSDDWRIYLLGDIARYEMGKNGRYSGGYEMKITLYDEAGNVTAVRESGHENTTEGKE